MRCAKTRNAGSIASSSSRLTTLRSHAVSLHQLGGFARAVERGLVGEVVGDAALEPVVLDAGGAHHVLQAAWL